MAPKNRDGVAVDTELPLLATTARTENGSLRQKLLRRIRYLRVDFTATQGGRGVRVAHELAEQSHLNSPFAIPGVPPWYGLCAPGTRM